MRHLTRQKYNTMLGRLALGYSVESVAQDFNITPAIAQQLKDKVVEQSTFLPLINVIFVDELKGQNILGSAAGPVTGRTDTSGSGERQPRDVLGLESYAYELHPTNADVFIRYATMDAWAKFPDMGNRYSSYVQQRMASDMEMIGWYGTSAAATTDLAANPMLQDVNKGWMQYVRENKSVQILKEGATAGQIRIGEGGDYANLDVAVNDLLNGIPEYMRKDLVALIGTELIGQEKAALFASVGGKPTEKTLAAASLSTFGGLPWQTPSNFPPRGLVITSLDNLSIYQQAESFRRKLDDNPKKDRVEDYNSRNEGYVVECPEKFVALEFGNVKLPDGNGAWE